MMYHNEVVLITGSSRGIGKAIATAFAKEGAKVVLNGGTQPEALHATYEALSQEGYLVTYFFGDLSTYEVAKKLFIHIQDTFGALPSIIINNAGISYSGLFTDTTPELWSKILTINLNSAYHCSYLGVPSMIKAHKGTIINISSIWGTVGASCEVAYSTSKAALNGFTKSLAKELGPSNIRVNALACGWIDTDMTSGYSDEDRQAFVDEIPLCRVGSPAEVANACLFLASSKASYLTGQVISLDGGLL